MRKLPTHSIASFHSKLFLLGFFAFGIFAGTFAYFQYEKYKLLREQSFQQVQRVSHTLSEKFNFFYHNVQHIALHDSLRTMNSVRSAAYFDSLVALYPDYDLIYLVDKNGRVVSANSLGNEGERLDMNRVRGKSVESESWFEGLKQRSDLRDLNKSFIGTHVEPLSSSQLISHLYEREKKGFSFVTPVLDSRNNVLGHVVTFVNESWPLNQIKSLMEQNTFRELKEGSVYLADGESRVLACVGCDREEAPPLDDVTSLNPFVLLEGEEQGDLISFFRNLVNSKFTTISRFRHESFPSALNWSLVYTTSISDFMAPLVRYTQIFLLVSSMVALIFFIFFRLQSALSRNSSLDSDDLSFSEHLLNKQHMLELESLKVGLKRAKLWQEDMRSSLEREGEISSPDLLKAASIVKTHLSSENFFDLRVMDSVEKGLSIVESSKRLEQEITELLTAVDEKVDSPKCPLIRRHQLDMIRVEALQKLAQLREIHESSFDVIFALKRAFAAKCSGENAYRDFKQVLDALKQAHVTQSKGPSLWDYDQLKKYLNEIDGLLSSKVKGEESFDFEEVKKLHSNAA